MIALHHTPTLSQVARTRCNESPTADVRMLRLTDAQTGERVPTREA
jgi:hypothetical protein